MRKGITESGFEFEIDENVLNDYRFMKLLAAAKEDSLDFVEVVTRMLGEEQEEKLLAHLEGEDGYPPSDRVIDEVIEIMTLAGEDTKNS